MSDEVAVAAVRSAAEEARLWAWARFPFIASILARVRIIVVRGLGAPAAVDGNNLYMDINEFPKYTTPERRGILMHETLHLALRDLQRRGSRDPRVWNIATDAVNNEILEGEGVRLPAGAITLSDLNNIVDARPGISKEELYDLLGRADLGGGAGGSGDLREDLRRIGAEEGEGKEGSEGKESSGQSGEEGGEKSGNEKSPGQSGVEARPADLQRGSGSRGDRVEVVGVAQEGEPGLARGDENAWAEAVAAAAAAQAQMRRAGRTPGGLDREVSMVLRPAVNWREILRVALHEGYGRTVVQDWRRESRSVPGLPGVRRFSQPHTWVLVDSSGSISQEEYDQFMAEANAVARAVDGVHVVFWDATVQGVEEYRRGRPLPAGRGGGGTVVRPALEEVLRRMRYGDVVVVLSDFDISDADEPEAVRLAREVARRAGVAVAATVDRNPPREWGWRTVRVEVAGA